MTPRDTSRVTPREALDDLFSPDSLGDAEGLHSDTWATTDSGVLVSLSVYATLTFVFSAIAIALPLPCGLIEPSFAVGAALGRLAGEGAAAISQAAHERDVVPAGYMSRRVTSRASTPPRCRRIFGASIAIDSSSSFLLLLRFHGISR